MDANQDVSDDAAIVNSVKSLISLTNAVAPALQKANSSADEKMRQVESERLLSAIGSVLQYANVRQPNMPSKLAHADLFRRLLDANDTLHERMANYLDSATATVTEQPELIVADTVDQTNARKVLWNRAAADASAVKLTAQPIARPSEEAPSSQPSAQVDEVPMMFSRSTLPKPQLQFADCVNNSNEPFRHKLKIKHHASVPWPRMSVVCDSAEEFNWSSDAVEESSIYHEHPYTYELINWTAPQWLLQPCQPVGPTLDVDQSPLSIVQTKDQLVALCNVLNEQREFAVDVEANAYRSYLGLVCLVQVSTRDRDYIVDPFPLWRDMHLLNEAFTNPQIVKVFHGADGDVQWLQRDFGIYVVGMFDTYQGLNVLNRRPRSLAHLVFSQLGVALNKMYRLADWRVRPLPEALIKYARQDTHYLLYCYDRMRNDLLQADQGGVTLLQDVLKRSRDVCLTVYKKNALTEEGVELFRARMRIRFNNRQKEALHRLLYWRDEVARKHDESVEYVLPNGLLTKLAELLPKDMSSLISACHPAPPLVVLEAHNLLQIIIDARQMVAKEVESAIVYAKSVSIDRGDQSPPVVRRPHDFSHVSAAEELIEDRANHDGHSEEVTLRRKKVEPSIHFDQCNFFTMQEDDAKVALNKVLAQWKAPYAAYASSVEVLTTLEAKLRAQTTSRVVTIGEVDQLINDEDDLPSVIRIPNAPAEEASKSVQGVDCQEVGKSKVATYSTKKQWVEAGKREPYTPYNYNKVASQHCWVRPGAPSAIKIEQNLARQRAPRPVQYVAQEEASRWALPKAKKYKRTFSRGLSCTVSSETANRGSSSSSSSKFVWKK